MGTDVGDVVCHLRLLEFFYDGGLWMVSLHVQCMKFTHYPVILSSCIMITHALVDAGPDLQGDSIRAIYLLGPFGRPTFNARLKPAYFSTLNVVKISWS